MFVVPHQRNYVEFSLMMICEESRESVGKRTHHLAKTLKFSPWEPARTFGSPWKANSTHEYPRKPTKSVAQKRWDFRAKSVRAHENLQKHATAMRSHDELPMFHHPINTYLNGQNVFIALVFWIFVPLLWKLPHKSDLSPKRFRKKHDHSHKNYGLVSRMGKQK